MIFHFVFVAAYHLNRMREQLHRDLFQRAILASSRKVSFGMRDSSISWSGFDLSLDCRSCKPIIPFLDYVTVALLICLRILVFTKEHFAERTGRVKVPDSVCPSSLRLTCPSFYPSNFLSQSLVFVAAFPVVVCFRSPKQSCPTGPTHRI